MGEAGTTYSSPDDCDLNGSKLQSPSRTDGDLQLREAICSVRIGTTIRQVLPLSGQVPHRGLEDAARVRIRSLEHGRILPRYYVQHG